MQIFPFPSKSSLPARRPVVLVLGDNARAEMQPLMSWLESNILCQSESVAVRDFTEISELFSEDRFPDLIVVLQSWSSEFSANQISQLLTFAPLARMVVCYGAWCESDGRNLNLWLASVRVPVWSAYTRIESEWKLIQSESGDAPLPLSASRDEVFAYDQQPSRLWKESRTFHVDSPDPGFRQFVIESLTQAGHCLDSNSPSVILFDADPWNQFRCDAILNLRHSFPQAEIVAMASLALPTQIEPLKQAGMTGLINKLSFRQQLLPT